MIEAMACGTPVIAFNRDSVPEVIEDGVTGFIVEDELSAIAAVGRLHSLPRAEIRKAFEKRFTAKIMGDRYMKVYQKMIQHTPQNFKLNSAGS
jgi:glycosyltransferase involved in cell wall biosynthesis